MGALTIESVFCEDIRLEQTLKHILIGVFSDEVLINVRPAVIGIAVWSRITGLKEGRHDFQIEAVLNIDGSEKLCGRIEAALEVGRSDRATIVVTPTLAIPVEDSGLLTYYFTFNGRPRQAGGSLHMTFQPDAQNGAPIPDDILKNLARL